MDDEPKLGLERFNEIVNRLMLEIDSGQKCLCTIAWQPDRGDSVLETHFWHFLRKTKMGWHGAIDQLEIGHFRVDCIVDCGGQTVVIELDGKHYHNADDDQLRDAELLQYVDAIIRIPFAALWHYTYATFAVLSEWFPRLALRGGHPRWVIPIEEYKAEQLRLAEYGYDTSRFQREAEDDFQVWERQEDMALVGSPSGRGWGPKMYRVWIQRGRHDARIMDQIYERSGCGRKIPI